MTPLLIATATLLILNALLWLPLLLLKRPLYIVTRRMPQLKGDFPAGITFLFLVFVREGSDSEELRRHEAVHFRQFRRWSPLGFVFFYLAFSLYWFIRTRRLWGAYWYNCFEVEARKIPSEVLKTGEPVK